MDTSAAVIDDACYTVAMLMFAALPLLSMRSRSARQQHGDELQVEPARAVAAVAFVLLLCLQARKRYTIGIVMVATNLALRLWELLVFDRLHAVFWAWTSQPRPSWRQSRMECAVLFCVFGASGSSSMAIARAIVGPIVAGRSLTVASFTTFVAVTAIYPAVLLTLGTLAGRRHYYWHFAARICGARPRQKRADAAV